MSPRWIFIQAFEAWAIARLLQSPAFHRAVRNVHRIVYRLRHGEDLYHPDELSGGTHIERKGSSFLKHFTEELKNQTRWKSPKK